MDSLKAAKIFCFCSLGLAGIVIAVVSIKINAEVNARFAEKQSKVTSFILPKYDSITNYAEPIVRLNGSRVWVRHVEMVGADSVKYDMEIENGFRPIGAVQSMLLVHHKAAVELDIQFVEGVNNSQIYRSSPEVIGDSSYFNKIEFLSSKIDTVDALMRDIQQILRLDPRLKASVTVPPRFLQIHGQSNM